jgi:hypothetical protein
LFGFWFLNDLWLNASSARVKKNSCLAFTMHATITQWVTLPLLLLLGAAPSASAFVVRFQLEGVLTVFSTYGLPDHGISVGDPFVGTLQFDSSRSLYHGEEPGYYEGNVAYEISVRGQTFGVVYGTQTYVTDGPAGDELQVIEWSGDYSYSPYLFLVADCYTQFLLSDLSGTALSSVNFPTHLELADWPDQHFIEFSGSGYDSSGPLEFSLRGNLTAITTVPEVDSATMLALGLLLLSTLAWRRKPVT